jgi:hypothetical protein
LEDKTTEKRERARLPLNINKNTPKEKILDTEKEEKSLTTFMQSLNTHGTTRKNTTLQERLITVPSGTLDPRLRLPLVDAGGSKVAAVAA